MHRPHLFVIMGPTASGKSWLAENIAQSLDCRLINADAFQVYRGMNIGTAKPEHTERYDLLDIKNPDEEFGAGEFVLKASELLSHAFQKGENAVMVGGTGFYIRALIEEYKDLSPSPDPNLRAELQSKTLEELQETLQSLDPEAYDRVDLQNKIRVSRAIEKSQMKDRTIQFTLPDFEVHKIGIIPDVDVSTERIKERTCKMMDSGWLEEVKFLLENGYGEEDPGFRAIGYRSIAAHLLAPRNVEYLVKEIELETIQYAKRQRTWLRSEPRLETYQDCSAAWDRFSKMSLY